jgi:hypothetical protein
MHHRGEMSCYTPLKTTFHDIFFKDIEGNGIAGFNSFDKVSIFIERLVIETFTDAILARNYAFNAHQ